MVDDLPNDLVPATGLLVHLQIPNIEPKATDKENGVVTFEEVPNGWVGVIVEDCRFEIEANACDPSPKMICLPFPPPPDLDFESEGYIAYFKAMGIASNLAEINNSKRFFQRLYATYDDRIEQILKDIENSVGLDQLDQLGNANPPPPTESGMEKLFHPSLNKVADIVKVFSDIIKQINNHINDTGENNIKVLDTYVELISELFWSRLLLTVPKLKKVELRMIQGIVDIKTKLSTTHILELEKWKLSMKGYLPKFYRDLRL